ncbi:S9 family peptidase [uncultured Planktosalinus sp.]|uniref:S9 family peptidase n=1 Tax=uncultured Planktosalinus sp. TaxID=1810935 RepID=UPI0030DB88BB
MRFSKAIIPLLLLFTTAVYPQLKTITLEEIWGGEFSTQGLERLHSLQNGNQYTVLNYDRSNRASTIDVYDYNTAEKVKTLVNSVSLDAIDQIVSYTFSKDEKKLLIATSLKSIYRRSTLGKYYVFNLENNELTLVSDNEIQEPMFSPDGTKVAYGFENNLFVKNLITGEKFQISFDGKKNHIINGITDWVYEEEFAFVRAFDWNVGSDKIAYIRFDETEVPEFSMDVYGSDLYPKQEVFKYPKAGEKNAEVSLHIYDLNTGKTSQVDLSEYESYYIPRLQWTNEQNSLSVQLTNRKQNQLDLVIVDAVNNTSKRILKETDAAYVDVTNDLTFLDDNSFIWTSEKSGWNHIYHYDKSGKLRDQITNGNWEVTRYYGFDENTNRVFYQSTENGSINRGVYSVKLNGNGKTALAANPGRNEASFSADFSLFIHTFSNTTTPPVYTLRNAATGKQIRVIKENTELTKKLNGYKISPKEFSTITINGEELNMYVIKPLDFDSEKQYPLLMYQYSGPGSQSVTNTWNGTNDYWHQMLAQQGYIIACVDGRGTGLKGRDFKKMTQKELGKYETIDQIDAAKALGSRSYIDANRIGIWGWSYGGFMSSNALFQGADTFSLAIAVAPVSSWRFYDTIYTERYMLTPQENPDGYDKNSPISHVDKLEGSYLLVHGSADDNVHVQNTTRLVEELVQANKDFEWAIYPDKNHGIYGGKTRLHLYNKMTNFILQNL